MKRLLTNKKGVTVLEGVIALGLLALIAGGAFAVLLAASRQTTQPDLREEMILAVEKADNLLKAYVGVTNANCDDGGDCAPVMHSRLRGGLCCYAGGECTSTPLSGTHRIDCLLPPICDRSNSTFTYHRSNIQVQIGSSFADTLVDPGSIEFEITCNGYTL